MGPSHWANAKPLFLASSRSSCLYEQRKTGENVSYQRWALNACQEQEKREKKSIDGFYFFFILRSLSACVPSFPRVIVSPMPISKSEMQKRSAHFVLKSHADSISVDGFSSAEDLLGLVEAAHPCQLSAPSDPPSPSSQTIDQ